MKKENWEKEWAIKRAISGDPVFQIDEEIKFIRQLLEEKNREIEELKEIIKEI